MRKLFFVSIIALTTISAFAQSTSETPHQNISTDSTVVYRLFATRNMYNFIKLNTRNGQMWQVQCARLAEISRKAFINATTNGEWTLRVQEFINDFRKQDEIERKEQQHTMSRPSNKVIYTWRGIPLNGGYKEYRKHLSASYKPIRKGRR